MLEFKDVSLLITHFNRSQSLERLLKSVKDCQVSFAEIIVSDDASNEEHTRNLQKFKSQYSINLIQTPKNKGLGNNINKGQDAVKTAYCLYIQEDFVPLPLFFQKLKNAHEFMENDKTIDFIRFYAYLKYPHLKKVGHGFSEMVFKHMNFWETYRKFYLYSDHPHLRRSNFFEKFGRYHEGIKSDRTEYFMMMQVLAKSPKAYFYDDYKGLILQENSSEEPSTVKRNFWRNDRSFFISIIRHIYRYIRFNLELIVFKLRST